MKDKSIGFNGVFSLEMAKLITSLGVSTLGFDCNPRSFFFIQEHKIIEILSSLAPNKVKLSFLNEKNLIMDRLFNEVSGQVSFPLKIEFRGSYQSTELKLFPHEFIYQVNDNIPDKIYDRCNGFLINESLLKHIYEEGLNHREMYKALLSLIKEVKRDFTIGLQFSDPGNLPLSIVDFIPWNYLEIEMSNHLTRGYRVLDPSLLEDVIRRTKLLL